MEVKKFTFTEVLEIFAGLGSITGYTDPECFNFNYGVARNHDKAKSVYNSLNKMVTEINKPCAEFDTKKTEILRKHSNGKHTVLTNGGIMWQVQKENEEKSAKELDELANKYKKELDERKAKHEGYLAKLDEVCPDFEPYLIEKESLPKNLASEHFRIIYPLIKTE